jgi:oxygen-dependent protoporphyrinogen oxidase
MSSIAFGSLLSTSAKLRASLDVVLPRRKTEHDCLGAAVRARFGRQVNERLVDPLIGSIYAADTDNFSLEAVPQVAALATERSMLLAARKTRSAATATGPVFVAPLRGMGALTSAVRERFESFGGHIRTGARVTSVARGDAGRYSVAYVDEHGHSQIDAHAVVLATPARHTADIVRSLDKEVADYLSTRVHASVALITVQVPKNQWKSSLNGSGYLVPKPDQRWVTAASFGSNKWAHWVPSDDSVILRVSLGRDGLDVMHHDDQTLVNLMLADLKRHLGVDLQPTTCRISRWPESFPQYRPHHFASLARAERALASAAPGVFLAGASYRGIGIPACVQQARTAAAAALDHVGSTRT